MEIPNIPLGDVFVSFAKSARQTFDTLMTENHSHNAKILETCWYDICAASSKFPHKIVPFNNPDALGLTALIKCRGYINGQMTDDELGSCARYLNSVSEKRVLYEYIQVFSFKYIDPWSVHVDAAYIYCKLRTSGIVSRLLRSQDPESLEQCQEIDEYVLTHIHPRYVRKYMRLAANKNTFATIVEFCRQAIDPMRDSQEYLCGLIEFIDALDITKSQTSDSSAESAPPLISDSSVDSCPSQTSPPRSLSDILCERYTCAELVVIARAFKINGLAVSKTKQYIINLLINKVGNYLSDPKFISDRISIWRSTPRIRSIKRPHSDII